MPNPKRFLYARLLGYVWPLWPLFLVSILGNILYSAVDSYTAYLFQPLLDKGFVDKDMSFLQWLPWMVLVLFLIRGLGSFFGSYGLGRISKRVILIFRVELFDRLLVLPASYFDQTTSGQILSKVIYNVDQVTQATGEVITTFFRQGALVVGLLIVMFRMDWQLTLMIFVVVPFMAILVQYASKRFRRLSRRIQNAMGLVVHATEETIVGYKEVRLFGAQQHERQSFRSMLDANYRQEMKIILTDASNTPLIQMLGAIGLSGVLYIALHGGHLTLSAGHFVAFLTAILAILKPLRDLTKINPAIQRGLAAAEGIFEILDTPAEKDAGSVELSSVKGEIEFRDLSFHYQENQAPILKHIQLHIPAGTSLALVGPSGSGKSTLVSLLARFYHPSSGGIYLDGHDLQDIRLSNLRQHMALVSQHVTLFNDTLFNNIAYGVSREVSEAEVIEAAKAAQAWEFIENSPAGLQTQLGENGLNLSGGQRQRVAIARAILKNAPILILDEATSALDTTSERLVQAALENLMAHRTTILIAHRLSTIERADCIAVIGQGEILERGTHQELLAKSGAYARLYQSMVRM